MEPLRPNWTVDEVLNWLSGKENPQRLLTVKCEEGAIHVTAIDRDGARRAVMADTWCDNELVYSEPDGTWLIAPLGWTPLGWTPRISREIFRSDMNLFPGGFTPADLETDQSLRSLLALDRQPRWRNPYFRADDIRRAWPTRAAKMKEAKENEAVESLADLLRDDPAMTLEKAKTHCREKHAVSDRGTQQRVWPVAREMAGLPRLGKVGRPKKCDEKS